MTETGTNALADLLRTPTTSRRAVDYEHMFDDFARASGGERVDRLFALPSHLKNPDYSFEFANCDLLLELKQINGYREGDTVDAYFGKLIAQGKVRTPVPAVGSQLRLEPDSLSRAEWTQFYKKFRPSVSRHLEKAAKQLKQTDAALPGTPTRPRICGLLLINSGDFNLPLDLMFRLVEWRTKREWKNGNFSKLDFVSCLTVDLIRDEQNPMQGRHIVRPKPHPSVPPVIYHIYDRWIRYYAAAIGAEVSFQPDAEMADPPLQLSGGARGKIRMVP